VADVPSELSLTSSQKTKKEKQCFRVAGLVQRWDMLQTRADDLQRVRTLQREMAVLRDELLELSSRVSSLESEVQDREQLETKIQQVKVSSIFHLKFDGQTQLHMVCERYGG
jgi:predicted RNase H-like nuclease (RuvC/YqgF family)